MSAAVIMFSHPTKRERERAETLRLIAASGGDIVPTVWLGAGVSDIDDFRRLFTLPQLDHGEDLVFLEDDIAPCRNALPYMMAWESPHLTSFYNPACAGRRYGLNTGFIFSQAFKMPAALVARVRSEPFPPPHPKLQRDGIDAVVNRYLVRWGLPFFQHRSLVEHTGETSTWTTSTLRGGGRRSIDFPGADADAFNIGGKTP